MNRSPDRASLLPDECALQHEHAPQRAPRPLPLFLELVRLYSERDPEVARAALAGLAAYERAPRPAPVPPRPEAARVGPAALRDHGGSGAPAVLIPSLINPPHILDLDEEVSLAARARERSDLSVSDHVAELLVPLLRQIGEPAALVGYCLGGTMAIAAANLLPCERVATLAAPWRFAEYPDKARSALASLWRHARTAATELGLLPMEVLQSAFWSLDPKRTVVKFAEFAAMDPDSPKARRFVALEDWANEGEPLPLPAARELMEDFFGADLPGDGSWRIGERTITDQLTVPLLHCTAARDRITPAASAPTGPEKRIAAGHVGMVVGSARSQLHAVLEPFLGGACR